MWANMSVLDLIYELNNFYNLSFFDIQKDLDTIPLSLRYVIKKTGDGAADLLKEISNYLGSQYIYDDLDPKNPKIVGLNPEAAIILKAIEDDTQKVALLAEMVSEARKFTVPLNTQMQINARIAQIQTLDEFEALYHYIKPLTRRTFILNVNTEKLKALIYGQDYYFHDLRHNWDDFNKIALENKFGFTEDQIMAFVDGFNAEELALMMAQRDIKKIASFMNQFLSTQKFITVLSIMFKTHNLLGQLTIHRCEGFILLLRGIDAEKQISVSTMPEIQALREDIGSGEQALLYVLIVFCYIKQRAIINTFLKSWGLFDSTRPFRINTSMTCTGAQCFDEETCKYVNQLQSVAILDIDDTLIAKYHTNGDMSYNFPLINGLLAASITNIYLYSATYKQEYETIKRKLKNLGFTVYGLLTTEETITHSPVTHESDMKKSIITQFVQNVGPSFNKVIICDDLVGALNYAEQILPPHSPLKLTTVHVKDGGGFVDKSAEKYQRLFTAENYRKYDGESARKLKKIEDRLTTYFKNISHYYNNTIMGNISLFFNKTHVEARLQIPGELRKKLQEYHQATGDLRVSAKQECINRALTALKKFKPRYFGNYTDSLQYHILFALYKYPEIKSVVEQQYYDTEQWDEMWNKFKEAHNGLRINCHP